MKKRYILYGLLAVVLIAGGYITYLFNFKDYDTADKEVDKLAEAEYDIELPETDGDSGQKKSDQGTAGSSSENTVSAASSDGNSSDSSTDEGSTESSGENDQKETSTASGSTNDGDKNNSSTPTENKEAPDGSNSNGESSGKTVADIKSEYRSSFSSLQSQAESRLSGLVGQAKSEYVAKKEAGEKISYAYFYQKYKSAAERLESKTDAAFSTIYKSMQTELAQHGHSRSAASEFKSQYENSKEARRSSLLSQVAGQF